MNLKELLQQINQKLPEEKRVNESIIKEKTKELPYLLEVIDFSKNFENDIYMYGVYDISFSREVFEEDIIKSKKVFYKLIQETLDLKASLDIRLIKVVNNSYEEYDGHMHYDLDFCYLFTWYILK